MKSRLHLAVLAGLALPAAPQLASAHHSHANLDFKDIQQHTGIVKEYRWAMPHVYIKVDAPNSRGELVEYSIEVLHPPAMLRRGWSATSFKPGDRITWEGAADRDPNRYYSGLNWAETADGKRLGSTEKPEPVTPSTDFTGLWVRDLRGERIRYTPPDWPYTERGKTLVAQFDERQNPQVNCKDPGPPKATLLPYPLKISRRDASTLVIEYELRAEPRIIHLGAAPKPGKPSQLGYSVGRLEGDELVVETTNFIADKWGLQTGVDSSARKHLVERFRLDRGGMALDVTMTITDPVYLTRPVTVVHHMAKLADRELVQAPCTLEAAQLFIRGGRD